MRHSGGGSGRAASFIVAAAMLLVGATGVGLEAASRDLGREVLAPNDGWASFGSGTTGGAAAAPEQTWVVTTRRELIAALNNGVYPGPSNPSNVPKIIYVDGTIDANADDDGVPLTCADYERNGYTLEAYLAAYDPAVWGRVPPSGDLENARRASASAQQSRIRIRVGSNTTIVGVDRRAVIKGAWLDIRGTGRTNIIIRNLRFEDTFDCFPAWDPQDGSAGNWNSAYDSISIRDGDHVWVDHNDFADVETDDVTLPTYFGRLYQVHDGLVDITNAASYLTVSWNRFLNHDKTMLIGSSDSATADRGRLKVTLHHNVFDGVGQRGPRVRFGQVHIFNDYYRIKKVPGYGYSWGVGKESAIYAEQNFFRTDGDVEPADLLATFGGTAVVTLATQFNAASANHAVDVRGEWNAMNDPDLTDAVGWTPMLFVSVHPAFKVPALVASQAGPFNW